MKRLTRWGALVRGCVLALAVPAGVSARSDAVTQWQVAALNYETAAEAQQVMAETFIQQAQGLRGTPAEDKVQRRARTQAGNLEVRAADLYLAAAVNLDHAARTWRQAAATPGAETVARQHFTASSDGARLRATRAMRHAADLCEQAAQGFAALDELLSQAAVIQKAAGIREQLARR